MITGKSGGSLKREVFNHLPPWLQMQAVRGYCWARERQVLRRGALRALIFFVTMRCNLRCGHCFLAEELDTRRDELDLTEIESIARSLAEVSDISLTGGEPFLRKDLGDIARVLCAGNKVGSLGIATNATLGDRVLSTVEELLKDRVVRDLSVQVSVDGLEQTHDGIRGTVGAYQKAEATLVELAKFRRSFPGFSLHVALAVQKANLGELAEVIDRFRQHRVSMRFNIVRGGSFGVFQLPREASGSFDPRDKGEAFLGLEELKGAYGVIKAKNEDGGFRFWSDRQERIWQLSIAMIEQERGVLPCYARSMEGVLYSDGKFGHCELSRPFANVRDHGHDLRRVWQSAEGARMRQLLGKCGCIHGCNLTTALTFEPQMVVETLRNSGCE